ncbi:NAD(P)/FAD-dependent oxidoreductase [Candidatus Woesearchaeota archaeon]|nr:NAD(P)/FAD-dependent oxidoreductase [Candidatus Woesearchaeota archaeon]
MDKPKDHFDMIVLGGGTAGLKAALECARRKLKTAIVDPQKLGGTCLNTGCIPSKAMLHASHLFRQLHHLETFGITLSSPKIDFRKLMGRAQAMVDYGQEHIAMSIKNSFLTVFSERAEFVGRNSIRAGGRIISGDRILISTGSRNFIPPIKGLEKIKYYTNETMLGLDYLPKEVVLIGGGYISIEYATFFSELGSRVIVLERLPQILSMLDRDVAELLVKLYLERGIELHVGANILELSSKGRKKKILWNSVQRPSEKPKEIVAEEVILAAGRKPNVEGLKLEAAGIKLNAKGGIQVNDHFQTTNSQVYAVGDVVGEAMFAHAASREAHLVLENMLGGRKLSRDISLIPWTVFTDPPISGVGLSEAQAKEKGIEFGISKANFARAAKTRIMEDSVGIAKVLFSRKNRHIIGATLFGAHADDLIHEITAIMNSSSPTLDVLRNTIHVHPTVSEVFDALKEVQ